MENHYKLFFKDTEQKTVNENETQKEAQKEPAEKKDKQKQTQISDNWNYQK